MSEREVLLSCVPGKEGDWYDVARGFIVDERAFLPPGVRVEHVESLAAALAESAAYAWSRGPRAPR